MRQILWTDDRGLRHRSLVRDNDPDSAAVNGVSLDPPSLDAMDWDGLKREIHNALLDHNITNWLAWQQEHNVLNIITGAVKRHLVALYRSPAEGNTT